MISRVGFGFVEGLYLAPFGISYFLAMVKKNDIKKSLLIFVSVVIGYLTGYSREKDVIIYVSILTIVLLCKVIFTILKKNFKSNIAFMAIIISIILGFVTIYFSAISSAKKASKVSPIDNLRNTNDIKISSKKLKTPKLIKNVFKTGGVLAYKNLKRSKKKYRTTVVSLTVSIFVFISMFTFINEGYKQSGNYYQNYENLCFYF